MKKISRITYYIIHTLISYSQKFTTYSQISSCFSDFGTNYLTSLINFVNWDFRFTVPKKFKEKI